MSDQHADLVEQVAAQFLRGDTEVLGAQTPEIRRLAVLSLHHTFTRRDSSSFHFGPALSAVERLPTPFTREDLGWALERLLRRVPTISDTPFWVPALIASALGSGDLGPGEFEEQLSAAFDALLGQEITPLSLTDLARMYGTALSGRHSGVPADLLRSASHTGPIPPELEKLLADTEVQAVFRHAAGLSKPVPTKAWLRAVDDLLAASPPAREAVTRFVETYRGASTMVSGHTEELLRGLVWMQSRTPGAESTALLSEVAIAIAAPHRRGAATQLAAKAAAAIIDVLAERPGDPPVRALAWLSLTVRSRSLLARIHGALDRLGRDRGWAPGEALELAVNDHGLHSSGRRAWPRHAGRAEEGPAGDGPAEEAVVEIVGGKARLLAYRGGVALRAMPAEWKDGLAEARAAVTAINRSLAVERARVEGLLSQERVWAWPVWAARYLDHPITGGFARRLIWQASPDGQSWTSGVPVRTGDGWTLSDLDDRPGEGWRVRLWHPALAGAAEVAHWRDRVAEDEMRQPFKQAYREVYPLTPAELETRTYSNRFAAHIVRYRQLSALLRERGWAASYLGSWDGGDDSEATKEFGAGEWRAGFLHERAEATEDDTRFCATDQVRFRRRDGRAWAIAPLAEVPPLVFSEAMRDIDLFVGVTSIAADDTWQDRGEGGFLGEYRERAAFAELTPGGELRRDVLARLLPRLAIGPRCEVRGRFLRVEGVLGAYRIHLGSGNILMEPDDAYLCIVPARRHTAKVRLPFEDDAMLSMILSKAILLAADDRITDPSIRQQLRRSRL